MITNSSIIHQWWPTPSRHLWFCIKSYGKCQIWQ